jgi:hypothetical protein
METDRIDGINGKPANLLFKIINGKSDIVLRG